MLSQPYEMPRQWLEKESPLHVNSDATLVNEQGLHAAQLTQQPGGRAIGQRGVKFVEQDCAL
jgi:hypothetical protein